MAFPSHSNTLVPIYWDTAPMGFNRWDPGFDMHKWRVGNWHDSNEHMRQFDRQIARMNADMQAMYDRMMKLTPMSMQMPALDMGMGSGMSSNRSHHSNAITSSQHHGSSSNALALNHDMRNLMEQKSMDFPIIEEGGRKKMRLNFDVNQFRPEELTVKTEGNIVTVHARHEAKSENKSVYREYCRSFTIPQGVNPEALTSTLRHDGVLCLEAPVPETANMPKDRPIPIKHM